MIEQEVEIYGKKYTLRGANPEAIKRVAVYLDQRLRELFGEEPKPIDFSKAFMLAINLAEELCNIENEANRQEEIILKKLGNLLEKVNQLEIF